MMRLFFPCHESSGATTHQWGVFPICAITRFVLELIANDPPLITVGDFSHMHNAAQPSPETATPKEVSNENRILSFLAFVLGLFGALFAIWEPDTILAVVTKEATVDPRVVFYFIFFACAVAIFGTLGYYYDRRRSKIGAIIKLLASFLPFALAVMAGMGSESSHLSWDLQLFAGIYAISVGSVALVLLHRRRKPDEQETSSLTHRGTTPWQWWIIAVVMLLQIGFGLHSLGKQVLVDEPLWLYDRIEKYWDNIAIRDWKDTRVNDKPGITVAILSGAALLVDDPDEFKKMKGVQKESFLRNMRLPIFLFSVLMIPVWFFFLARLLGGVTAVAGTALIALHPLLLGMSRMVNPDALFWIFTPLSIVAYASFLISQRRTDLYATGLFFGLALLTKYVANALFIHFLLMILLAVVVRRWETIDQWKSFLKKNITDFVAVAFIALAVFYLLLPATWVMPNILLKATIRSQAFETTWPIFAAFFALLVIDTFLLKNVILTPILEFLRRWKRAFIALMLSLFLLGLFAAIANVLFGMRWADFEEIVASPKSSHNFATYPAFFLSSYYSLFFGVSPIILVLSMIGIAGAVKYRRDTITVSTFVLFILVYYVGTTTMEVGATVRYQIVLYPMVLILAALGAVRLAERLRVKLSPLAIPIGCVVMSALTLLWVQPYYFSYASSMLPERFVLNPKDMGDGSYQAAQYLNSLPNAANITIWSDKSGVCSVFVGQCKSSIDFKQYIESGVKFDYYVVSRGREAKNTRVIQQKLQYNPDFLIRFDKLYGFDKPVYTIELGDRSGNFIKVIDARDIDISHSPDPTKAQT